jgi:F-type H+-transporting ATPase subunit gamma
MSGNLQSLQRKIAGAADLEGVVRSMKALAASSIGQYEKALRSLDDYYRTVGLGLAACIREAATAPPIPRMIPKPALIGAIIFGSDQGLVGGFNEVLLEYARHTLDALPGKAKKVWAAGERMQALATDIAPNDVGILSIPTSVGGIARFVGQVLVDVEASIEKGEVEEIYLFYNHPNSDSTYECASKRLLPIDRVWEVSLKATPWPTKTLPQIVGELTPTLESLIREYLFVLIFRACAESLASENASRLAAMQRAEKNIEDILEDLNSKFHRLRQEAIDEELFDVISGYEALTSSPCSSSIHC